MRALLGFALISLVSAAAGCGANTPTGPMPTIAGRWEGTLFPHTCQPSGTYTTCYFMPQRPVSMYLLLEQEGPRVSGHAIWGAFADALIRPQERFESELTPDGRLEFSVTQFADTPVPMRMEWSLRFERRGLRDGVLVGSLIATQTSMWGDGANRTVADVLVPLKNRF
jgi:hypothetical protein